MVVANTNPWRAGISAAVDAARVYSRRTPAVAINTAAFRIAVVTSALTPAVPPSRIDSELSVEVVPRLGKRGQPLSLRSAKNRMYKADGTGSGGEPHPDVPLSWLIISARAKAGSRFNQRTASRWLIRGGTHPLKGARVAQFASIIGGFVTRMVKSRRSSTSFLKSFWRPAITQLKSSGLISPSALRGLGERAPTGRRSVASDAGWAIPAREGITVTCEIANAAGMRGSDALNRRHNEALHQYGGPALDQAIRQEWLSTLDYIAREEFKRNFGKLESLGFQVIDV